MGGIGTIMGRIGMREKGTDITTMTKKEKTTMTKREKISMTKRVKISMAKRKKISVTAATLVVKTTLASDAELVIFVYFAVLSSIPSFVN